MKVIYNNGAVDDNELTILFNNRAFQYGDGLFETIIYQTGVIRFFNEHFDRISRGMAALGMQPPKSFDPASIENSIYELIKINKAKADTLRIKLIVWRNHGGLFTPLDKGTECAILLFEQKPKNTAGLEAAVSTNVKLYPSLYSRFKTCNMLPYVLAGLEKENRKLSELILLDYKGHVAECSTSNVFWIKRGRFYTPSLETGCIEGIMRGQVIKKIYANQKKLYEVKEHPEKLLQADLIFTSNVSGINLLKKFENRIFENSELPSFLNEI